MYTGILSEPGKSTGKVTILWNIPPTSEIPLKMPLNIHRKTPLEIRDDV